MEFVWVRMNIYSFKTHYCAIKLIINIIQSLILWYYQNEELSHRSIIAIPSQPVFALTHQSCVLSREATNTNFIVLHWTTSGLEPTIYHTRREHATHITTDTVCRPFKYVLTFVWVSVPLLHVLAYNSFNIGPIGKILLSKCTSGAGTFIDTFPIFHFCRHRTVDLLTVCLFW